ncbi:MAG: exosome complex protein Rrp42 [archaeon]
MNNEYIFSLIEKNQRVDGRKLDEYRDIKIETNLSKNAEGSAKCSIGDTEVIAGVKLEIGTPYSDSPDEGTIIVNAELSPMANPKFELGPPGTYATELARIVDRGIRESKCLDFKKLCIKEGEKVWIVLIDLYIINDDGNLIDASVLAALNALKNTIYPGIKNDKVNYKERTKKKLELGKMPVTCTLYIINNKILIDVNTKEEECVDSRLSVAVSNGRIHALQKGGNKGLSIKDIEEMIDIAIKKEKELRKFA